MRFVLAIVSFVLAAVLLGLGVAQRTIFASPDEVSLAASIEGTATVTVIDGTALNAFDRSQTVTINGDGPVFAAYGRTTDVVGWVGDTTYNHITFDSETGELVTEVVRGSQTEIPAPGGSDLWLEDYLREDQLALTVNVPADVSFIVASDGIEPAPDAIAISWPIDNSTPFAGPLIVAGAVALLLGLGFLLWATNHMRRGRGPKRKPQKMPKVPRQPLMKPRSKSVSAGSSTDTPAITESVVHRRRRGLVAIPLVLVSSLALAGCSPDFWPSSGAAATPTPTATDAPAVPELDPPAVTVRQMERIIAQISEVATTADAASDAELLATRFDGPALQLRLANYAIRAGDAAIPALPAIPAGPVEVTLPQQTDTWPRTVFVVIKDDKDATIPPLAMFLVQEEPRAAYKVNYAMTMEPSAVLPDVAPAVVGAPGLPADNSLLRFSPADVASAYADILEQDAASPSYEDFEAEGDSLRAAVGLAAKEAIRAALPTTASVTFGHSLGEGTTLALATNDAGAIVAINLNEITTVAPIEAGAAVNPSGQVKALSGLAVTTKGVVATYGDQLLFYVPPAGSDAKIVLLGYSQGLISATEIP